VSQPLTNIILQCLSANVNVVIRMRCFWLVERLANSRHLYESNIASKEERKRQIFQLCVDCFIAAQEFALVYQGCKTVTKLIKGINLREAFPKDKTLRPELHGGPDFQDLLIEIMKKVNSLFE